MQQLNWFDRTFDFSSTENILPTIIERLAGTPARLEEKCKVLSPEILIKRFGTTWTIKENVGHLADLEPLWQGRLEDILAARTELRPTDLQNTKTTEANHNSRPIDDLLSAFRAVRKATVDLLEKLEEEHVFLSALHPRLKSPMRTQDLFLFVAEHDDHHLKRITELVKLGVRTGIQQS